MERLQKVLATAGCGSRRTCEQFILQGRVTVNGEVVTQLGTKVDVRTDHVAMDGRRVATVQTLIYVAFHKPKGVLSTANDPGKRQTALDYMHGIASRIYPVGRLDYDSEGLLLLSNDGQFTHVLTHPKHHVPKTYWVYTDTVVHGSLLDKLREGIVIDGQKTHPAEIEYVDVDMHQKQTIIQVTIHEGRNRQIRRMFEAIHIPIQRLKRVAIGNLQLDRLPRGKFRHLRLDEVNALLKWANNGKG